MISVRSNISAPLCKPIIDSEQKKPKFLNLYIKNSRNCAFDLNRIFSELEESEELELNEPNREEEMEQLLNKKHK